MNSFALQLANGNLFFVGLLMAVAAFACLLGPHRNRILRSIERIACITGMVLVIASATPVSFWLYGLWLSLSILLAVVLTFSARHAGPARWKINVFTAMSAVSLLMGAIDFPYHFPPCIEVSIGSPVYVLGDSISAGMGTGERNWPDVLAEISHLKIVNLAQPGATVESALKDQVPGVKSNALVILEIGGNDQFNFLNARLFQTRLDQLLGAVSMPGNQVVMFELPLIPFQNTYGQTQRLLAKKYGVKLIPKYYLTRVFGLRNGTLDGLHLSQTGHNAMAESVLNLLKIK